MANKQRIRYPARCYPAAPRRRNRPAPDAGTAPTTGAQPGAALRVQCAQGYQRAWEACRIATMSCRGRQTCRHWWRRGNALAVEMQEEDAERAYALQGAAAVRELVAARSAGRSTGREVGSRSRGENTFRRSDGADRCTIERSLPDGTAHGERMVDEEFRHRGSAAHDEMREFGCLHIRVSLGEETRLFSLTPFHLERR